MSARAIASLASLLTNPTNLDLQEWACAALANILSNCNAIAHQKELFAAAAPRRRRRRGGVAAVGDGGRRRTGGAGGDGGIAAL